MGRLLLFLLVLFGIWWLRRKFARDDRPEPPPRARERAVEAMRACAHCGVHVPESEALIDGAHAFCSDQHRRLGPRTP